MSHSIEFENFYQHDTDVYSLKDFVPRIVNREYLKELGVEADPSEETLAKLEAGSRVFMERLKNPARENTGVVIPFGIIERESVKCMK